MILTVILSLFALIGLALLLWQWVAALRFPLHYRTVGHPLDPKNAHSPALPNPNPKPEPAVTLLKSVKGADAATEGCLRSWFAQDYAGDVQILFAVASVEDPVCAIIQNLIREFHQRDTRMIVCGELIGANAKVSKLAELEKFAKYEILVVSDADVRVPSDFLANAIGPLRDPEVGLVNCFYRLANPSTLAMQWEAIAMNADFWSQVLQSQTLQPLDFALGAVMLTRRRQLAEIGGFKSLADCLADDYQLGNRIARNGHRIVLSTIVVECWDPPMTWTAVWKHQLRWARTIRVSQPAPYFFSILSNAGPWALLLLAWGFFRTLVVPFDLSDSSYGASFTVWAGLKGGAFFLLIRLFIAGHLQCRLTRSYDSLNYLWLVPVKDFLQGAIWVCAFAGNRIEWRGQTFHLRPDGTLAKPGS